uniref:YTH domain-containing family protein n=1 Tax=Rhizophora mucronata TaxID=61149 RepID=A0A2P2KNV1_RHIMU
MYANSGNSGYRQGYDHTPFGSYPSPYSPVPTVGHDAHLYGTESYQYPSPFYQPPSSTSTLYPANQASPSQVNVPTLATVEKVPLSVGTATGNTNYVVNSGSMNKNNGLKPFRPENQNSSNLNGSYRRGSLSPVLTSSGYQDPSFGYDGYQSSIPWLNATGSGFSSPMNSYPTRPTSGFGQASGFMNFMYPNNRMYGCGMDYGSFGYNSWTNGRGWVVVDNKYKPRGHGFGNENLDGLSELNRGPRAKDSKNQKEFGHVMQTGEVHKLPLAGDSKEDISSQILEGDRYNREDFPEDYSDAKFFVIKSYSEDDVHKSIKYGVWSSTPNGNKKLDAVYREAMEKPGNCPLFLLFSVNTSGQFVGLAEMVGSVDYDKTVDYWQQEKWIGCFPVKWHIIKDVPNSILRPITLESNDNKPVTNSRDTQEVVLEKGIQILKIFKSHKSKTSILDDFAFYAARERIIQERRAKQKTQKQVLDGRPADGAIHNKNKSAAMGEENLQKSIDVAALMKKPLGTAVTDFAKMNLPDEAIENSPKDAKAAVSSPTSVASIVVASAC